MVSPPKLQRLCLCALLPSLSTSPSFPLAVPLPLCKAATPIGILPPCHPPLSYSTLSRVSKQWCCWSINMTLDLPHSVMNTLDFNGARPLFFRNSASRILPEPPLQLLHRPRNLISLLPTESERPGTLQGICTYPNSSLSPPKCPALLSFLLLL